MSDYCPCGNPKTYKDCCEPYISGKKTPETAEQLMRSRYTAFTKGKVDYIFKTHQTNNPSTKERNSLLKWMNSVEWLGLAIIQTEKGQKEDEWGWVEFRAIYIENQAMESLHEKSFFKRLKGRWIYISGEHLLPNFH
jgi:SEC-C motif-containing protein